MIDFLLLIIIIPFAYSIWVAIDAVVLYRIDKRYTNVVFGLFQQFYGYIDSVNPNLEDN